MIFFLFCTRAYADAGPSVQHSEQPNREGVDFVRDTETESEKSVEASSGDEEARDEGKEEDGEGKKKKARSGFRDRKVINKHSAKSSI